VEGGLREGDYAWLGGAVDKHYAGDDSDLKVLMRGILQACGGQTVEEFAAAASAFLADSNGDVPMLRFAGRKGRPALRLLVLHDDAEREFDYVKGAEQALERAKAEGWTVASIKNDWAKVFADQ
jgi:hypothetical protein